MRVYGNIRNAKDLIKLQSEAPEGEIAVGITDNANMYIVSSDGLIVIGADKAKELLSLSDEQFDQFIQTRGRVTFEEPIEAEVLDESDDLTDLDVLFATSEEPVFVDDDIEELVDEQAEAPKPNFDMVALEEKISELIVEKLKALKEEILESIKSSMVDVLDNVVLAIETAGTNI